MMVDLVILNVRGASYLQDLDNRIVAAIHASPAPGTVDRPGGVFHRRRELLGGDVLAMLRGTARVHLDCDGRSLARLVQGAVLPQEEYEPAPEPTPARSSGAVAPGLLTQIRVRAVQSARSLLETAASVLGEDAPGAGGAGGAGVRGREAGSRDMSPPPRPGAPAPLGTPTPEGGLRDLVSTTADCPSGAVGQRGSPTPPAGSW